MTSVIAALLILASNSVESKCAAFCQHEAECRPVYAQPDDSLWESEPLEACPARCAQAAEFFARPFFNQIATCAARTDCRVRDNPERACRRLVARSPVCVRRTYEMVTVFCAKVALCAPGTVDEAACAADAVARRGTFYGCAKTTAIRQILACVREAPCDEETPMDAVIGACFRAAGLPH